MEANDRTRLQRNRNDIVEDLDVKAVLDHLISEDVFDGETAAVINGEKTKQEKARKLLDTLPQKGPRAYSVFRAALAKRYDFLVEQLDNTDVSSEGACASDLSADLDKLTVKTDVKPKAKEGATSCSKKQPPKNALSTPWKY